MNEANWDSIPVQSVEWFMLPFLSSPWPIKLVVGFCVMIGALLICWGIINLRNRSLNRSSDEYWSAIKDHPMAVVLDRLGTLFAVGGIIGAITIKALS